MGGHGGGDGEDTGERHAGYGWLFFCAAGMMGSLTLYGVCMEYVTSGGRKVHEFSFLFVTTAIYAAIGFVMRSVFNEKPTDISKYNMLVLSCSSIASTFTSVRSLRYVIYPVQILFKSCKPVPVMAFGVAMGKQYPIRKYVNVAIITCGVALFMGGGSGSSSSGKHSETTFTPEQTLIGAVMLSVSLCFDGATGAYEDKLMSVSNVEPFDLMYNIQLGKAVLSFCMLTITNGLGEFISTISNGGIMLVMLGLSGALGQVTHCPCLQCYHFPPSRLFLLLENPIGGSRAELQQGFEPALRVAKPALCLASSEGC
jgi:UDP-galactose transporter B1